MVLLCLQQVLCSVGDVNISGTEHRRKLKFSMQTYLTHINTIGLFECCHASVILGKVDVLEMYVDQF